MSWASGGAADFNADGKADILWTHNDGASICGSLDGLILTGQAFRPALDPDWSIAGVLDFNADRRADIFLRHTNGQNYALVHEWTEIIS